jgi:methylmalonyl-CoA mutase cobalamin-binding domain/chain
MTRLRVLVVTVGLDDHDRGVTVVARALRPAGAVDAVLWTMAPEDVVGRVRAAAAEGAR